MKKTEFTLIVIHGSISTRELQANLTRVINRYRGIAGIVSARITRRPIKYRRAN